MERKGFQGERKGFQGERSNYVVVVNAVDKIMTTVIL